MWRSGCKIPLLALLVTFLAFTGFAQESIKIGIVNSNEVISKSTEGKAVMGQLQDKDKSNSSKIATMDEKIRELETKLNTQRLTLTQESILQLTSELERKRTERKRFAEDSLRELQELRYRLFTKVQDEVVPIIEGLGKERNLDIIFDLANSGAVYINPTIDLTAEVIKRYDASKATKK
jgi:Skp family chaperone for outer membrane proteins